MVSGGENSSLARSNVLSKVGGWRVERRWTLLREVAFASKVGICRLRVKGIDLMVSVHARGCQGTGIPPRPADQIDYHGNYLSDSGAPLGNWALFTTRHV